ncbi:MAG: transcription initiation factor IIB family protein [Candidatus Nanoarchaeia archaeon]|nr:transcription initiation factor IIB family protein [Candidatus Nanoarchaeia archaeon]
MKVTNQTIQKSYGIRAVYSLIEPLENILLKKYQNCIECETELILNNENYWICKNCGLEYGLNIESTEIAGEKRMYNNEEMNNKKITQIFSSEVGPRTFVGDYGDNNKVSKEMKPIIKRIQRIQNQTLKGIEYNYKQALFNLNNITYNLDIADYVKKTAWKIYKTAYKKKIIRGRTLEGIVVASICTAIKVHEIPLLQSSIIKESTVDKSLVENNIKILIQEVLPILNLKYKTSSVINYIPYLSEKFNLDEKICLKACNLYNLIEKKLKYSGKDPKGYAAAVLYLSSLNSKKISQKYISSTTGICTVTLRRRIQELQKYIKE